MNEKEIKKNDQLSAMDIERMEMLQKANEKTGKQLTISSDTGMLEEIDELRFMLGKEFENPQEKYDIYYNGIRKVLMQFLPKEEGFKIAKKIIYDEKNIFLNLGKKKSDNNGIRKSDGRMTFQTNMNEILDIIVKWVAESQNPFELYKLFYELNDKFEYGHENYDETNLSFSKAMLKLSKKK